MEVIPIMNPKQKQSIARAILEDLTDWFGLEESREEYIEQAAHLPFLCAMEDQQPVGFLCLKQTGKDTAEIQVMGVLQDRHGHGIGKALVDQARRMARKMGCSFLQVKTVQMGNILNMMPPTGFTWPWDLANLKSSQTSGIPGIPARSMSCL